MEPFVLAFALIGLVMAVLIVGNVISGAVIAQYQRIGVLKSLGLTPAQVVAVYLRRVAWPALAGCVIGVAVGGLLSLPVLHKSAGAYGVGSQQCRVGAGHRPGRDARADPARRARPGAAGRTAVRHRGDRRRARAADRPRLRRHRLAARLQPAAPDRPWPGRAVRQARPHPGDAAPRSRSAPPR